MAFYNTTSLWIDDVESNQQAPRIGHRKSAQKKRPPSSLHDYEQIFRVKKEKSLAVQHGYLRLLPNILRNNCSSQACYPPIKNLLIGRKKFLFASSTCGLNAPQRFCTLGSANKLQRSASYTSANCMVCDSREPFQLNNVSHRIENVINEYQPVTLDKMRTQASKWWQSENGMHQVFIQFDLESEFVLSHVLIRFRTFPPAAMLFEKSADYGRTWQTVVYFATNCNKTFPFAPLIKAALDKAYCIGSHSNVPSTSNNEVVYRPLSGIGTVYDPVRLQNTLRFTNMRINLTQLYMLGDNLMDTNEDSMEKYYYAISDMKILGTCFCNGHASRCTRKTPDIEYDSESLKYMLFNECNCEHNTAGKNCESCLPLYNDRAWQPAYHEHIGACVECKCNKHATSCHFDEALFSRTNGSTGGVCDNCMHNTEGVNCEKCKRNFYHDERVPFDSIEACKRK